MNARNMRGGTYALANAIFAKGTTSTYSTTNSTVNVINGKFATALSAQTNTATPTTDHATGAAFVAQTDNTACVYVFGTNAAGAVKVCQGSIVPTEVGSGTTAGAFRDPPQFPMLPDDFCPNAYLLVRTAPDASDWTFGTSSWTATGVTASAVTNVSVLPDRPQTA